MQSYAHTWAFVLRFIVKQLAFATWFCHNSIPERTFRPALTKTSSSTPRIFCYSVKRALARPDSARSQHPCLSQRCWIEWGRDCKQWSQVLRHYPGLAASSWRQTGARDDVLLKHKMHFSKLLPQTWKPTVNLVKQNFMPWHKKKSSNTPGNTTSSQWCILAFRSYLQSHQAIKHYYMWLYCALLMSMMPLAVPRNIICLCYLYCSISCNSFMRQFCLKY